MSDTEDEYGTQSEYSSEEEDDTPEQIAEKEKAEALRIAKVKQDKIDRAKRVEANRIKQEAKVKAQEAEEKRKREALKAKLEARKKTKAQVSEATPTGDIVNTPEWTTPPSPPYVSIPAPTLYDQDTPNPYGDPEYELAEPYKPDNSFMEELDRKEAEIIARRPRTPPTFVLALPPQADDRTAEEIAYDEEEEAVRKMYEEDAEDDIDDGWGDFDPDNLVGDRQEEETPEEANLRQIEELGDFLVKRQDKRDAKAQAGLDKVNAMVGRPSVKFTDQGQFTMDALDANDEFRGLIEGALETPQSKAEEAQRLADEAEQKRIKRIFYAKGTIPDFPWTEAQAKMYLPKTAGEGEYSQASEKARDKRDRELEEKYGEYDPNANAGVDKYSAFAEESSDDESLEDVPFEERREILNRMGNEFYGGREETLELVEPLPWEENPRVLENYSNQMARKIAEQKAQLEALTLATPYNIQPIQDDEGQESSDGLITDDEGDAEEAERERVRQLVANAPAIRPDLEATAKMGAGKHGKKAQRIIFPQMPKSAYEFTTEGKSYGEDTKSFLEQQRDAMLKMRTPSGQQFTSMFPKDSAGNTIPDDKILPWIQSEDAIKAKIKADERKQANIDQRQKDYEEDKETYLTDKKLFTKKVKAKRLAEEKEDYTNTPAFFKSFNFRKKKKKPVKKASPPPSPQPSPPPSPKPRPTPAPRKPKPKTPQPTPTPKPRPRPRPASVKKVKKKLVPVRQAPAPPKPTPKPRPRPRPAPQPQTQGQKKRATRSDKGQHHKWSDGRENTATYKRNKAKGVDWSAVRCRASTCWEVGDRKTDAKGKGAFKKNESSGEYVKQLRQKPKKKKKKKEEERREEDGWF